jgi:archaellum component FlaC
MIKNKQANSSVTIGLSILCVILLASTIGTLIYYNHPAQTNPDQTDLEGQLEEANKTITNLNSQLALLEDANDTINDLNNQISSLQTQLANAQSGDQSSQIATLQTKISNLNKTVTQLTDYYNSLMYVLNTELHDTAVALTAANNQKAALQTEVENLRAITSLNMSATWIDETVNQNAGSFTHWNDTAEYAGYLAVTLTSTATPIYVNVIYSSHGVDYDVQFNLASTDTAYFPVLPSDYVEIIVGNGLASGTASIQVAATYYY